MDFGILHDLTLTVSPISGHAPPTSMVPIDLIFCQFQEKPSSFHPRAITLAVSCLECSFNSCSLLLIFEVSMQMSPPHRGLPDHPLNYFYHIAQFYFPLHFDNHKYFHYFFLKPLFFMVFNKYFLLSAILGTREQLFLASYG